MTTTSFQDDFHRGVESASDRQIGEWFYDASEPFPNFQDSRILSLIARIKAEREQTIRECAEIAHTATMFTGCPLECMADEVRDAVLSLLQSNGEDK